MQTSTAPERARMLLGHPGVELRPLETEYLRWRNPATGESGDLHARRFSVFKDGRLIGFVHEVAPRTWVAMHCGRRTVRSLRQYESFHGAARWLVGRHWRVTVRFGSAVVAAVLLTLFVVLVWKPF